MRNLLEPRPSGRVVAAVTACMMLVLASLVYSRKAVPEPLRKRVDPEASVHAPTAPLQPHASVAPGTDEILPEAPRPLAESVEAAHQRPAPVAIAQVFPGITEPVTDWRTFRPEKLTVVVQPDLPIEFTRTALREEGRYVTWIGRNAAIPGSSFVAVATPEGYDAILVTPGDNEFGLHVRGDKVLVTETNPGEELCGNHPLPVLGPIPLPTASDVVKVIYAPGFAPVADVHAAEVERHVDVLFVYETKTLAGATTRSDDPVGYLEGRYKAMIESANLALAQSGVTEFAWRFLGLLQVPDYTSAGATADDLDAMVPSGSLYSWVSKIRYDYGADQIMMMMDGDPDYSGRAYSPQQRAVSPNFAVGVMRWSSSFFTMAHELGHNFGCQHDRENAGDDNEPVSDSDGFWCYGQLWLLPAPYNYGTAGTIMSYGDWRIPYFSNPAISIEVTGSKLGWSSNPPLGTHQIGRAETDPKAANNVRVFNEQALAMSRISGEVVPPQITQQPESITVSEGHWLQLGVTATGGGLRYQWMKDGAVLDGATSTLFGKTAVSTDAGNYHVVVANRLGSLTSTMVSVTVNRPAPSNPASSGGGGSKGGGGGGGGAVSTWFMGLLVLCSLLRWGHSGRR